MIDITYGNDFGLRITLRRGSEAFPVTSTSDLTVRLINEAGRGVGLRPRLEDGVIVVDKVDADDVAVGIYGLEVVHRGTSGKWRTMGRNVLRVTYETVAGGSHADAHGDCYDIDVESQVVTFPISATVQSVSIQVQSDWEQTDDTKPDFIKNKPSIPDTSGFATEEWVTEQGYLTRHQDISGKQDVISDLQVIRAGAALGATALQAESDPTVPSWAKQPNKPAYTAQEVGALPADTPLFSGDYNDLGNKPTIPTVPTNVSAFTNDAGYLTSHQDISGKEDRVVVDTISGTTLTAAVGKYYVGSSVGTLAITLPTVSDSTHIASVVLNLAMGSSPAVTFTAASGVTISYSKGFALAASKEYEVNCLWQGTKWIVMENEIETPS